MKIKNIIIICSSVSTVILIAILVLAFRLVSLKEDLQDSYQKREKSIKIANHLKQTSEDLTKYCRTYVVTGDTIYENKFYNLLAVRDGLKARKNGRTISLIDSMKKLGFTEAELQKLKQSKKKSDELIKIEEKAFNAIKGFYADTSGNYTIKGQPNPTMAIEMMFNETYRNHRDSVMQPIENFFQMFNQRTANTMMVYQKSGRNTQIALVILIIIGLLVITGFLLCFYKELSHL